MGNWTYLFDVTTAPSPDQIRRTVLKAHSNAEIARLAAAWGPLYYETLDGDLRTPAGQPRYMDSVGRRMRELMALDVDRVALIHRVISNFALDPEKLTVIHPDADVQELAAEISVPVIAALGGLPWASICGTDHRILPGVAVEFGGNLLTLMKSHLAPQIGGDPRHGVMYANWTERSLETPLSLASLELANRGDIPQFAMPMESGAFAAVKASYPSTVFASITAFEQ